MPQKLQSSDVIACIGIWRWFHTRPLKIISPLYMVPIEAVLFTLPLASAEPPLPELIPLEDPIAIDGDTVAGRALLLPGQRQDLTVRLLGIDAPEMKGKCPAERKKVEAARAALAALLKESPVFLAEVTRDKYYGRVVARLVDADGHDLGATLLQAGYARPYAGAGLRPNWCAIR